MRAMSRRRQRERAERAAVVALVMSRDEHCTAADLVPSVACGGPLDPHEVIPRSAWAKGYLDPNNVRLVCRTHHCYIDDHPHLAWSLGLHGFSWERPDRAG